MKLLVVDDHAETRQLLARSFTRDGHAVTHAESCAEAYARAQSGHYDVIVLDVMLPDGSGFDLCKRLREGGLATPILLLTARGQVGDRVQGLDAGADDYLAKPFAVAELLARVRALGRRGATRRAQVVSKGSLTIDFMAREVRLGGEDVPMTAREFAIVALLASRGGVVSRVELLESIWGEVTEAASASMEVLMGRIRRKLGGPSSPIRTIRGMGYALVDPQWIGRSS